MNPDGVQWELLCGTIATLNDQQLVELKKVIDSEQAARIRWAKAEAAYQSAQRLQASMDAWHEKRP